VELEVGRIDPNWVKGDIDQAIVRLGGEPSGRCFRLTVTPKGNGNFSAQREAIGRFRMYDGISTKRALILIGDVLIPVVFDELREAVIMIAVVVCVDGRGAIPLWVPDSNYIPNEAFGFRQLTRHCNPLVSSLLERGRVYEFDHTVLPEYRKRLRRVLKAGGIQLHEQGVPLPVRLGPRLAAELQVLLTED
jgi:hypothetical protein